MPRIYKRQPGSRRYQDYSQEKLDHCLNAVRNKEITQRQAEEIYRIPRRTIINKLRIVDGQKQKKPGYQQIFSKEEEDVFEKCIIGFCDFGFPLTVFDLRMIVHSYLNRIGRTITRFKNNVPGEEWAQSFLKRHPNLNGSRLASNIKRSRAAIDEAVLRDYITNLTSVVADVPASNVWNYDESNLTDDPGRKKVIAKRGCKYPERICNSSKTSISLMMCGSAAGELLPPYVIYRSGKLWDLWTENGPVGTRYNNTTSGWFDSSVFTDWFQTLLLPKLKKLEGKKVLIGDNLSSHITLEVLDLCEKNQISFVCLPPNSTHLTQPLDVAFFAPMKRAWRKILTNWKETAGLKSGNLDKSQFPSLLKKLISEMESTSKQNLMSGFRKCGIFPINLDELLQRLPQTTSDPEGIVEDSFLTSLEEKRKQWTETGKKRSRKSMQVPAGKSIGPDDLPQTQTDVGASTSGKTNLTTGTKEKKICALLKGRKRRNLVTVKITVTLISAMNLKKSQKKLENTSSSRMRVSYFPAK